VALSARLAAAVDALPLRPEMRMLEIGCGPGAAARAVAERLTTGHILAIDRSAAAVAQAVAGSAEVLADGRMSVRRATAEDFVREPGEGRSTWCSPCASGRSTDGTRRRAGRRSPASPRHWHRAGG
jgi:SAM-dependent methyltransferase